MTRIETVYRIQDAEGRGPWRPGVSAQWIDDDGRLLPEAPISAIVEAKKHIRRRERLACACLATWQLRTWITPTEYKRLLDLGYRCVRLNGCRVITDLGIEVIVARRRGFTRGAVEVELYDFDLERSVK